MELDAKAASGDARTSGIEAERDRGAEREFIVSAPKDEDVRMMFPRKCGEASEEGLATRPFERGKIECERRKCSRAKEDFGGFGDGDDAPRCRRPYNEEGVEIDAASREIGREKRAFFALDPSGEPTFLLRFAEREGGEARARGGAKF